MHALCANLACLARCRFTLIGRWLPKTISHHFGILLGFILASFDILLLHSGVQNRPWGCPRRFRKRGCEKNALAPQSAGQKDPQWDPKITRLVVFSMFSAKLFPNHFWDGVLMVLGMVFG